LPTAYAVVPEVYRKHFQTPNKDHSETFSEFAFHLSVQLHRWLESEEAYDNVDHLHELIQPEQFNTSLDPELCSWLLDQKPKNMSEAVRQDQHVAIHTAGRFNESSREWKPRTNQQRHSPRKHQSQ